MSNCAPRQCNIAAPLPALDAALDPDPRLLPLRFGAFLLDPGRRSLHENGRALPLGGRAFDVLMALVERRGRIVSKDELMDVVWPGRIVEENTLHAQISILRRVCQSDPSLIRTVAGRGYQFSADVTIPVVETAPAPKPPVFVATRPNNLPAAVSTLYGREDDIVDVGTLVARHRLVSLIGAGGVGKSRLALDVARASLPDFGGAWLIDLSAFEGEEQLAVALQRILSDASAPLRTLLILDNCEHLIDAAAQAAADLLQSSPALHILVTSREGLRLGGEHIVLVPALSVPDATADRAAVLASPAVQLFLDRAMSAGLGAQLDAGTERAVAEICRHLEGNALAIELAAARATVIGIEVLAQRLDERLHVLTGGHRLAPARQKSLRASLEWSYRLLSERERTVLRRLALFSGRFTLDAARTMATGTSVSAPDVDDCVMELVAKSLLAADLRGTTALYSMSETTRIFARELIARGEPVEPPPRLESAAALMRADEAAQLAGNVVMRVAFGARAAR